MLLARLAHFRIRDGMLAVAAVAVVCAWPAVLVLVGIGLWIYVEHKLKWKLTDHLVVILIVGVLVGLCFPPVTTRCRFRRPVLTPTTSVPDLESQEIADFEEWLDLDRQ